MVKRSNRLQQVYDAVNDEQLSHAYSEWASRYDRDLLEEGYILPFFVPAFVARHVAINAGPILDAGVGTGLSGPYLRALGYQHLVGMDMSEKMLAVAEERRCYNELKPAVLGQALPWPDDHFAAVMSAGVFTEGHAPAAGLDELVRITRAGGFGVFNIRESIFAKGGFDQKLDELQSSGQIEVVETSPPFASFAFDNEDVIGRVHVLKIL